MSKREDRTISEQTSAVLQAFICYLSALNEFPCPAKYLSEVSVANAKVLSKVMPWAKAYDAYDPFKDLGVGFSGFDLKRYNPNVEQDLTETIDHIMAIARQMGELGGKR